MIELYFGGDLDQISGAARHPSRTMLAVLRGVSGAGRLELRACVRLANFPPHIESKCVHARVWACCSEQGAHLTRSTRGAASRCFGAAPGRAPGRPHSLGPWSGMGCMARGDPARARPWAMRHTQPPPRCCWLRSGQTRLLAASAGAEAAPGPGTDMPKVSASAPALGVCSRSRAPM